MDLIAISYYNIGPFKDKILNIFFDKGKFLIRAPIGSGKSFLFFDGPTYALYKHTGRNVLNVDSKSGFIKLLFEVEGQKYLVVRNLTQGKTKDICKSRLLIVNGELGIENKDGKDIEELLKEGGANLEEITFKNERDLEGNLSELLPPREVFLSTVFLLQDSENIFELEPAKRLIVMKNIFNLVGIDEIKDQIANKRRDIQTTLKVKSDTSNWDFKIKSFVTAYVNNYKNIQENFGEGQIPPTPLNKGGAYKEFIQELETVANKVNINEFSLEGFDKSFHIEIEKYISDKKGEYKEVSLKLEHHEKIKSEKLKIKSDGGKLKEELESKIKNIDEKINKIDPKKIENKKKEKLDLIGKSDEIFKGINLNINIPNDLVEYLDNEIKSLEDLNNLVNTAIAKGQNFADQKTNIKLRIEKEEVKIENEKKNKEIELKNLNENKKNLEEQHKNILNKINDLNKTVNDEAEFNCVKINANCPFIKDINKKTFEELERQIKSFKEEKAILELKVKSEEGKIKELRLGDEKGKLEHEELKKLNLEYGKIEKLILELRKFLTEIDFKNIQNKYKERREIQTTLQTLDKEIISLENGAKELENYKNEKIKTGEQILNIEKENQKIEKELEEIGKEKLKQKKILETFEIEKINKLENINKNMQENLHDIKNIIDEFKDSQLSIKKLKEDEKVVKDLYQIFSKELLLFVLEGYLPVLTDIINSFLAQVVEYNIDIKLLQKNEHLEMDVKVYDEKGERDIKSLSGGQKVILKLVWMLAISSYMKSPILFLDETINNLDNDTVGKVAEMLSDFVKQRDLKLYTVTHSQQIQEMDIWDRIIHIEDFI
ncbi:MAG TPA: SMC family ATPase [Candidatus Absconditabacterales bacterium]|nr:SMC family ATPase [Candidatus Absconditabacterales bacterium]